MGCLSCFGCARPVMSTRNLDSRQRALAGAGVRAEVEATPGHPPVTVWVGRRKLATDAGLGVPDGLEAAAERLERQGRTVVWAGWDGEVRGVLAVADTLKPGAAEQVARLHAMGLEVAMLTGDNHTTAAAIAASDLTLLGGDLDGVATAIQLSRRTYGTIVQNLGWAFGYNTAAIPLAAAGLLNPIIAGAAMAFSSVSVVTNSLRLRRFARRHPNRWRRPRSQAGRGVR